MDQKKGHLHPITQVISKAVDALLPLGFVVARGPEIETEFFNFDALNMAKDHPARDMQDTFWVKQPKDSTERLVMRTQTSGVQVRYMQKYGAPCRILVPGKVFRMEATDATHEAQFHQLEGLCVDKKGLITMGHLKFTLETILRAIFGHDAEIRMRPSFFSFVEPGLEVDVKWKGKWLEVVGAGMVHPNVLKASGVDPEQYSGFAFGFGLERLAMITWGIPDVRLLFSGDTRFLNQF